MFKAIETGDVGDADYYIGGVARFRIFRSAF